MDIKTYLELRYKDYDFIPIECIAEELLVTKATAKVYAKGLVKSGEILKEDFIKLIVSKL